MYETRKKQINDQPDYEIDGGFGGPVPLISEKLGNLRFFTSYRSNREMLLFPLSRPDYRDYDWSMQLTSDITPSMKLRISSLVGKQFTIRHNWDSSNNAGLYFYPRRPNEVAGVINDASASTNGLMGMFSDYNFPLADIGHRSVSVKLTHAFSSTSFYEVTLDHFRRDYNTRPAGWRDRSRSFEVIPGYFADSYPFGYWPYSGSDGVVITFDQNQHVAKTRDFSVVSSTTLKADFSTQVNFHNLVKAGIEFDYNDLDFDYGVIKSATAGQTYSQRVQLRAFPIRAAAYLQDKLETQGFTMNAGVRLDYSDAKADWWEVNAFDALFFSSRYNDERVFPQKASKPQWQLSPRLGIAHPITENSKLFFNYGHFKQVPQYESLFRVERGDTRQMTSFGDPNLILAKTISYELGYDQILFNDFLLQLAAFYNDITDQQDFTRYTSSSGGYTYTQTTSNNYEDVRGFEATLRKTSGRWWSGFANFTYQVSNTGHFGSSQRFDNPAQQKSYNENTLNLYQDRPIPRPNARTNINLYTPIDFGPSLLGHKVFGGYKLNVLLDWQAGYWTTWSPKDRTVAYNVKARNFFNVALRLDKTVEFKKFRMQFFMDMNNALNTRRLWNTGDVDYLASLHLPRSEAYSNIPGNDKVGDYRKPGVAFVPMEYARTAANLPPTPPALEPGRRLLYYVEESGSYMEYQNGAWQTADPAFVNQVLKDKAYIDMPNASTYWFLDPRQIYFGVRLSFDLTE
jgi:outer membrane receptor protein involved in Fe transport